MEYKVCNISKVDGGFDFMDVKLENKYDLDALIRLIHHKVSLKIFEGNMSKPEYLLLGAEAYEAIIYASHKKYEVELKDEFMGMKIIVDSNNPTTVEVVGSASEEFSNFLRNKYLGR